MNTMKNEKVVPTATRGRLWWPWGRGVVPAGGGLGGSGGSYVICDEQQTGCGYGGAIESVIDHS